jgi:hypothetical protein
LLQENKKINGKTFFHIFTKNSSGPASFRLVEKKTLAACAKRDISGLAISKLSLITKISPVHRQGDSVKVWKSFSQICQVR